MKSQRQDLKPGLDDSKANGSSSLFCSGEDNQRAHRRKKVEDAFSSTVQCCALVTSLVESTNIYVFVSLNPI